MKITKWVIIYLKKYFIKYIMEEVSENSKLKCENEYIFELKTVQSSACRILIEALKEILTDANIDIDESGIKIMTMDPSHTVLVHLKLGSSKFEK